MSQERAMTEPESSSSNLLLDHHQTEILLHTVVAPPSLNGFKAVKAGCDASKSATNGSNTDDPSSSIQQSCSSALLLDSVTSSTYHQQKLACGMHNDTIHVRIIGGADAPSDSDDEYVEAPSTWAASHHHQNGVCPGRGDHVPVVPHVVTAPPACSPASAGHVYVHGRSHAAPASVSSPSRRDPLNRAACLTTGVFGAASSPGGSPGGVKMTSAAHHLRCAAPGLVLGEDGDELLLTDPAAGSSAGRSPATRRTSGLVDHHAAPHPLLVDNMDTSELQLGEVDDGYWCFPSLDGAATQAGAFVRRVLDAGWKATHFHTLPDWLQDNDFLHYGHRPPMPSFSACLRSIFRVHTETGNIWTHMLGCLAFIGAFIFFMSRPSHVVQWKDKLYFSFFFAGAIGCLGLSTSFHTVICHSRKVHKVFSKLDYCGITLLIVGSFIPWLYYGFYCRLMARVVYTVIIVVLGTIAFVVSLWDKFGSPRLRPFRAGIFVSLGLSGVIPGVHFIITDGFWACVEECSMFWLILMAVMYIFGALLYALRIPERWFPGKFDIWLQSHTLFHVFVVGAAFVYFHGVMLMASNRLASGTCAEQAFLKTLKSS